VKGSWRGRERAGEGGRREPGGAEGLGDVMERKKT